jgi:hypothetical protein
MNISRRSDKLPPFRNGNLSLDLSSPDLATVQDPRHLALMSWIVKGAIGFFYLGSNRNKPGETLKYSPSDMAWALLIDRFPLTTSETTPLDPITPTKSA